jgi:hypothetical protein
MAVQDTQMEQSKGRIINEWDILDENLHRQEAAMPFSRFVARSAPKLPWMLPRAAYKISFLSIIVSPQLSAKHRLQYTPVHQSYATGACSGVHILL